MKEQVSENYITILLLTYFQNKVLCKYKILFLVLLESLWSSFVSKDAWSVKLYSDVNIMRLSNFQFSSFFSIGKFKFLLKLKVEKVILLLLEWILLWSYIIICTWYLVNKAGKKLLFHHFY